MIILVVFFSFVLSDNDMHMLGSRNLGLGYSLKMPPSVLPFSLGKTKKDPHPTPPNKQTKSVTKLCILNCVKPGDSAEPFKGDTKQRRQYGFYR